MSRATKKNYTSGLGILLHKVFDAAKTTSRRKLDSRPHFVPIDMSVLEVALSHILGPRLKEFEEALVAQIRLSSFKVLSATAINKMALSDITKILSAGPIVIEYNRSIIGVLFKNYNSAGKNLFTPIINKTLSDFAVSGGFDIGHLVSSSKLAKSPLQLKIDEVKGLLSTYAESKNSSKVISYVVDRIAMHLITLYNSGDKGDRDKAIEELNTSYKVTKDIDSIMTSTTMLKSVIRQSLRNMSYKGLSSSNSGYFNIIKEKIDKEYDTLAESHSYGNTIVELDMVKTISPALNRVGAIITIIQDRAENQKEFGSRLEGGINRTIKNKIIGEVLTSERFSPSLKDNIESAVIAKLTGKKVPTKKSRKTESVDVSLPKSKISKGKTEVVKPQKTQLPALRNIQGQFTSLTSLQNLLNMQLHDQIKKNMHRPNLKYQTGRFAESVKVEQLSRARDGAITAFMSYMRYPYATFEVGGKQGHKGYYPSRLINTSVRELAAKLVKEKFTSITIK